jgi:hypothetical protein
VSCHYAKNIHPFVCIEIKSLKRAHKLKGAKAWISSGRVAPLTWRETSRQLTVAHAHAWRICNWFETNERTKGSRFSFRWSTTHTFARKSQTGRQLQCDFCNFKLPVVVVAVLVVTGVMMALAVG